MKRKTFLLLFSAVLVIGIGIVAFNDLAYTSKKHQTITKAITKDGIVIIIHTSFDFKKKLGWGDAKRKAEYLFAGEEKKAAIKEADEKIIEVNNYAADYFVTHAYRLSTINVEVLRSYLYQSNFKKTLIVGLECRWNFFSAKLSGANYEPPILSDVKIDSIVFPKKFIEYASYFEAGPRGGITKIGRPMTEEEKTITKAIDSTRNVIEATASSKLREEFKMLNQN